MMATTITAVVAIGHFCLLIAAINRLHGLGIRGCRWLEPAVAAGTLLAGALSLLALAGMARVGPGSWPVALQLYAACCGFIAAVCVPAITLARRLRRPPVGLSSRGDVVDLADRDGRDSLIGDHLGWLLRIPGNESLQLARTDWTVGLPDLPPALDGLSILHITDLHFTRAYARKFFEAVAGEVGRLDADLVCFTGDLLDDEACLDWIGPVLGRLRGQLGTYATLGNHDLLYRPDRVAEELARAGFHLLDGSWDRFERAGTPILIGGTNEPWGPPLGPAPEAGAAWKLVLSHTPDRVYPLARSGVDLVLSGHNHGGQARLPLIGPVLMPSLYGRRFDQGFFRVGPTLLYVSRGVGAKYPLRFRCPPEIARIVLRRQGVMKGLPRSHPARQVASGQSP